MNKKLNKLFSQLKIRKNQNIIFHSNIAGILQFNKLNKNNACSYLFNYLKKKITNKGTLLVPTYNYDFTKGAAFNLKKTPSQVGFFSNYLLKRYYSKRTPNPVFSHLVFNPTNNFNKDISHNYAFGTKSIFNKLLLNKFKIICFCCSTDRITFLHHIENLMNVEYRFLKKFKGTLIDNNKKYNIDYNYFVAKKNIKHAIRENKINNLIDDKFFIEKNFGRFKCYSVDANMLASKLLKKIKNNIYYLIK